MKGCWCEGRYSWGSRVIKHKEMFIQERRMRLAGHIHRHEDLIGQALLLWEPTQGVRGRGRHAMTFVDTLRSDTGLDSTADIGTLMADRQLWRDFIKTRTMKPP